MKSRKKALLLLLLLLLPLLPPLLPRSLVLIVFRTEAAAAKVLH
jgi:hypothetical protein